MKKIIFAFIFLISSITFSVNNEAMVNYIIKTSNGKTSRSEAQTIVNTVTRVSKKYNFPESYIYGIIETESNFRNLKANRHDARGVMQVTPGTSAKQVGCSGDLYNIEYNIECGVKYFDWMRKNAKHYGINNLSDLAAAYNCGPGCFKSGRWKNIKETTNYIKKVPAYANKIAEIGGLKKLDMKQFPAGTAGIDDTNKTTKSDFSDVFKIDFDRAVEIFKEGILSKVDRLIEGVIVILTFMALFDFILTAVMQSAVNPATIVPRIINKLIKYAFYIGVVLNFVFIQTIVFEFFSGFATLFGVESSTVNQVWELFMKEAEKLFNLIVSWNEKFETTKWTLMPEMILIAFALIAMIFIAIRVVIELSLTIIQFFLTTTLALFFVPFDVFDKMKSLTKKLPKSFLISGIKITTITIVVSIVIGILSNMTLTTVTDIKDIKDGYEDIFKFIAVQFVGLCILLKSSEYVTKYLK